MLTHIIDPLLIHKQNKNGSLLWQFIVHACITILYYDLILNFFHQNIHGKVFEISLIILLLFRLGNAYINLVVLKQAGWHKLFDFAAS